MKRIVPALLALILVLTALPVPAFALAPEKETIHEHTEASSEQTGSLKGSNDTNSPYKVPDGGPIYTGTDSAPPAATLLGTTHLPPIGNQGAIGSCTSEAVTYCQFTNAVSRYLHSIDPLTEWDPSSGNWDYIFSPKFTFDLTTTSTPTPYVALQSNGSVPMSVLIYEKEGTGHIYLDKNGNPIQKSTMWGVDDIMKNALNYRYTKNNISLSSGYSSSTMIKSAGTLLKVKQAIADGNVVVFNNNPSYWQFGTISKDGDIAKKGDSAIVAAVQVPSGGHAVAIIGYDDNAVCNVNGVEVKGAFLIANSWGTDWYDSGYAWLMYDSIYVTSAYEELNDPSIYTSDMYLTSSGSAYVMGPQYLASSEQALTFTKTGTEMTVTGKSFPVYNIQLSTGEYVGYNSSRQLVSITDPDSDMIGWCFIPYETLATFSGFSNGNYDKSYEGSYWMYAVGLGKGSPDGYWYMDAGVNTGAAGRSVGIASLNGGQYPEAKSWIIPDLDTEVTFFQSKLGIFSGRGQLYKRSYSLSTFYMTYWQDVTVEMPEVYLELDVTVANRNSVYMAVGNTTSANLIASHFEANAISSYATRVSSTSGYPVGDETGSNYYYTFSGVRNGEPERGKLYIALNNFEGNIEENLFGVVIAKRLGMAGNDITVHSVKLLSGTGNVLYDFGYSGELTETVAYYSTTVSATILNSGKLLTVKGTDMNLDCTVTAETGAGYTVTPSSGALTVKHGEDFTFTVDSDGTVNDAFTIVMAGDKVLQANEDGSYTLKKVINDMTVTVKNQPMTVTVDLIDPAYTAIYGTTVLPYGAAFSFTLEGADPTKLSYVVVKANGTRIFPDEEGVYTLTVYKDVTVTVDGCPHDQTEWRTLQERSCFADGIQGEVCLVCQTVLQEVTSKKLSHSYRDKNNNLVTVYIEPTVFMKGYACRPCQNHGCTYYTALTSASYLTPAVIPELKGDLNLDGQFNIADVTAMLTYLSMDKSSYTNAVKALFVTTPGNDFNGDGNITIEDVTQMLNGLSSGDFNY